MTTIKAIYRMMLIAIIYRPENNVALRVVKARLRFIAKRLLKRIIFIVKPNIDLITVGLLYMAFLTNWFLLHVFRMHH